MSGSAKLLALVSTLCLLAAPTLAAVEADAPLTPPLKPSDLDLSGMTLTLTGPGASFETPTASTKHYELTGVLKVGQPTWRVGLRLPGPAWIYRCLTPGSLKVTLQSDPDTTLVEGRDYVVNMDWASVCAVEGSACKPGTQLVFSYDYGMSRLDKLVRHADGRLEMLRGKEDKGRPPLPATPKGATALLSVYLPPNTTTLTMDNINLIDPAVSLTPPLRRLKHTASARRKLREGKGLTVVFLGDSITAQQPRDFTDGKGSFVVRFASYLRERFGDERVSVTTRDAPKARQEGEFLVVQSGVGGNTTADAVKRLRSDVLDHKPDLVIVLFGANDENRRGKVNAVPPGAFRDNLTQIVQTCRKAGSDVILLTPPMKNLGWEATFGNMDQYARMTDMVAESQGATLIDSFAVWQNLPKLGYNYMIALGTCINHPVDIGHEIFFHGIKAVLEYED